MNQLNYIFITILAFFFLQSNAQTTNDRSNRKEDKNSKVYSSREAKKRFVWGGKFGVNRSNVYDEQGMDFVASSKTGFAGGLFAAIPLGSLLGIQPEVLISQKGFSGSGTINNEGYTLTRTTTHLDIPLQLQLKPLRFFSIVGGIQYSYLLSQSDELSSGANSLQQSQEFKNDNIRKNSLGAVTGFDINIRHIMLSGRVGCDMQANRGDGSSYTPRYKNVWLQGTVGYRIY
ncbi:MAG: PorT family protein [Bacteroidetes bacterium]|nr:PorT family protein [Bacteroidota bacterium]